MIFPFPEPDSGLKQSLEGAWEAHGPSGFGLFDIFGVADEVSKAFLLGVRDRIIRQETITAQRPLEVFSQHTLNDRVRP